MRMHEGEVDTGLVVVRSLLAAQFPEWSSLPLSAVPSTGTVNTIYRLGDSLCVRLPRVEAWAGDLRKELEWLPRLAPCLSLRVPRPVARGAPGDGYPFAWAIYEWLPGETFDAERMDDEAQAAADLAQFASELRGADHAGAPRSRRDRPLRVRDPEIRAVLPAVREVVDLAAVTARWDAALAAPAWDGTLEWTHGDLLPPNLLLASGRLVAVLDFGNMGLGDPAVDVVAAWTVFGPDGRAMYRDALGVDDGTWARARGLALHQALMIIPYYADTNPGFVAMAKRTVDALIDDAGG